MNVQRSTLVLLVVLFLTSLAVADVYLQNPRGSNNRNCEDRNQNTGNGNRLFRSENNAGGGYNCPRAEGGKEVDTPRMYYYEGSILRINWFMQHSCQLPNVHCQVVLQYMCEDTSPGLRDGIPDPKSTNGQEQQGIAQINQANKDNPTYGQHENFEYFNKCNVRDRNKNLFIADRNINGNSAQFTRQNEGGTQYGFECQEERDYYPYWHPNPWRDIAVFTTNSTMCDWYKAESHNVVSRGECFNKGTTTPAKFNNDRDCLSNNGDWKVYGAKNTNPPECKDAGTEIAARDNHLGMSKQGDLLNYEWTIPSTIASSCVVRIRYNISTGDYHPWTTDSTLNGKNSPIYTTANSNNNLYKDFGFGFPLAIKMNTNQVFRTFEDRTYVFEIKKRKPGFENAKIYNLNLAGKRGNLANQFPNMEYDFIPNQLTVNGDDYLHIQWTGSDYNPNRATNAAEGGPLHSSGDRTCDRTNLVQIDALTSMPRRAEHVTMFKDESGNPDLALIKKLALLDQPIDSTDPTTQCLNFTQLVSLYKTQNKDQNEIQYDKQNCAKLGGAASPYFDAGLVQMRAGGTFYFLSTRNNNFSNRSQRGQITVVGGRFAAASTATISITMLLSVLAVIVLLL